jgi:hypothetical protein
VSLSYSIVFNKGREYPSSTKEFPWIHGITQRDAFTCVEGYSTAGNAGREGITGIF